MVGLPYTYTCKGTVIAQISPKEERESDQGESPSFREEELDEQEEKPAIYIPAVFRRPFEHVSSCKGLKSCLAAILSVSPDGRLAWFLIVCWRSLWSGFCTSGGTFFNFYLCITILHKMEAWGWYSLCTPAVPFLTSALSWHWSIRCWNFLVCKSIDFSVESSWSHIIHCSSLFTFRTVLELSLTIYNCSQLLATSMKVLLVSCAPGSWNQGIEIWVVNLGVQPLTCTTHITFFLWSYRLQPFCSVVPLAKTARCVCRYRPISM